MTTSDAERFWDARAREHALFFVDNRLDYRNPDVERFWADGERVLDEMLGAVGVTVGRTDVVVDIGCGVGRLSRALAARARRVIAIDVSREMLACAEALNPGLANVEWRHGDGRTLTGVDTGPSTPACRTWCSSTCRSRRSRLATSGRWGGCCGREAGRRSCSQPTHPSTARRAWCAA